MDHPAPRLAQAMLRLCLPAGLSRDALLGDLQQEYANTARASGRGGGRIRARAWYWQQTLCLGARFLWEHVTHPRRYASARGPRQRNRRLVGTGPAPGLTATPGLPPSLHAPRLERRSMIDSLAQDLQHAFRALRKSPGTSALIILTLALAVGINTAVFSIVNAVLLQPLPYHDPERLIQLWEVTPDTGWGFTFSPPNFVSYREQVTLLEEIVAYGSASLTLTGSGEPERLPAMQVSAGFFEFLGVSMLHGRPFLREEDSFVAEPGTNAVVILSHGTWQRRFGEDPEVVGTTIRLDGIPRTVVGIVPAGFRFGSSTPELWVPWIFERRDLTSRGRHWLQVLGRLRPGVELDAAARELSAIAERLALEYPETNEGWGALASPLLSEMVESVQTRLLILLGAVGFVLLIGCANVSNLLLARAEGRGREMTVRAALGAGRGRLIRLLLTESLVLASLGGAAGFVSAYFGLALLMAGVASELPRAAEVSVDGTVLAFAILTTVLAGVLAGSVPAWHGFRRDLLSGLKEGSGRASSTVGGSRVRGALVVAEVALSLVLVVGAGLLTRSFWQLTHVDPGFNQRQLLTGQISLPTARYESDAQRAGYFAGFVEAVEQLPGVESAAAATGLPIAGGRVTFVGVADRPDELFEVERRRVTPRYFRTMGIPLVSGRDLSDRDRPEAPHVVVVNEAFARRAFPNEPAIGKFVTWGGPAGPESLEIVGVVGSTRQYGLSQEAPLVVYLHYSQIYTAESMYVVVRSIEDPLDLAPSVRGALSTLDPELPIYDIVTMEEMVAGSVASERISTLLLASFAVIALLLGTAGIYGVLSYSVLQRTHEVGVRLALGARSRDVLGLVIRQGMLLALGGIGLGVAGALALSRYVSSLLFEVSATDPLTFCAVVVLLAAVSLAACFFPARRAAKVDPMVSIRWD